ncbi:3-hydroxyacyl-[acyl-carrier-protein] dehydratase, FabZ form [hydrothermal vent metagenome]|uniref:3-hydroxyacyl-[acyl-carrier-protein] dehydratase n=1 Tax=hydrothermal vent metagenome TaxID=652676 RepID=A0A3B0Z245_9ZZZZ
MSEAKGRVEEMTQEKERQIEVGAMDIHQVMQHLPHRYPFLLVDKVVSCVPGETLTALKNVTINEPFFPGHFPIKPVMPGVLILEALAQATAILTAKSMSDAPTGETLYYLVGIDNARFKQPVEPGDQLILKTDLIRNKRSIWKFDAKALVDDNVVASAEIICSVQSA